MVILIVIVFVILLFLGLLSTVLGGSIAGVLDEIIIIFVFTFSYMFHAKYYGIRKILVHNLCYIFLFILVLSTIINGVSYSKLINQSLSLIKPTLLFLAIIQIRFSVKKLKFLLSLLLSLAVFESVVVFVQTALSSDADAGYGTLNIGSQHHLGYFLFLVSIVCFSVFFYTKKYVLLFFSVLTFYAFFKTNTQHALITIPLIGIIFYILLFKNMNWIYRFFSLIFPLILIVNTLNFYESVDDFLSDRSGDIGKIIAYQVAFFEISHLYDWHNYLFGLGPASYSSEVAQKMQSPYYSQYVISITDGWGHDKAASTTNHPWSSVISLYVELGMLGILSYLSIVIYIIKEIFAVYFCRTSLLVKGLALGSLCSFTFWGVMCFIINAAEDMLMTYPVFALAAIVISFSRYTVEKEYKFKVII
ncbi:MAG: hypothetical protein HRU38_19745 [Saccharospirillaceae bacterium]|nr:hypothetical protein [Saccharospirillaceae bacterium]